jgi:hypothetical protein
MEIEKRANKYSNKQANKSAFYRCIYAFVKFYVVINQLNQKINHASVKVSIQERKRYTDEFV